MTNCIHCTYEIEVNEFVNDRAELAKEKGDSIELICENCKSKNSYHVNKIRAKESKVVSIVAFCVFLSGTGLIAFLLKDYLFLPNNPYNVLAFGGVLLIPSMVFMVLNKHEGGNVKRFNQYQIYIK